MTVPLDRTDTSIRHEVLEGLLAHPKTLPPKLFYDAAGAALFEQITTLPEYYLTGAELGILRRHAGDIAALVGPNCALIEYGSGAGVKVRLLLDALEAPAAYVPIDISAEQLARVSRSMKADYPELLIRPVAADYTAPLTLPSLPPSARRVGFFPGSTIGNLHPAEATAFLSRIRRTVGPEGALVLGVDRLKDVPTIEAAYNDAQGVTAEFNRNILRRINRELDADFPVERFEHRAFFNSDASRIEMHLVAPAALTVRVGGSRVSFEPGESIWTESSYKYDDVKLEQMAGGAGFTIVRRWTDESERFWVVLLQSS